MFSCAVGREGHCKQRLLARVEGAHSGCSTLGLPQPKAACTSQVHTAQAPARFARALSQVDTVFRALPSFKLLRFSEAPQGHRSRWAVHFVVFPGRSSSGDWVLVEHPIPSVRASSTPPRPRLLSFLGTMGAQSQECPVSPLGS